MYVRYFNWDLKEHVSIENDDLNQEILEYLETCKIRYAIFYKSDSSDLDEIGIRLGNEYIFFGRWKYVEKRNGGYRIIDGDKVFEDIRDIIEKYEGVLPRRIV